MGAASLCVSPSAFHTSIFYRVCASTQPRYWVWFLPAYHGWEKPYIFTSVNLLQVNFILLHGYCVQLKQWVHILSYSVFVWSFFHLCVHQYWVWLRPAYHGWEKHRILTCVKFYKCEHLLFIFCVETNHWVSYLIYFNTEKYRRANFQE